MHHNISIDFYHHFFQYVETNLSKDLFMFGNSSSEAAVKDMCDIIEANANVSQSAAYYGDPHSLTGLSLYIMSISYLR